MTFKIDRVDPEERTVTITARWMDLDPLRIEANRQAGYWLERNDIEAAMMYRDIALKLAKAFKDATPDSETKETLFRHVEDI